MTAAFRGHLRAVLAEQGISVRELARLIPCDSGHLTRIINGQRPLNPEVAARIDDVLGTGGRLRELAAGPPEDLDDLLVWLHRTNVTDSAVEELAHRVDGLGAAYVKVPPLDMLATTLGLQRRACGPLRSGRQRLRQTRALFAISAEAAALAALLASDVARYDMAAAYATTARTLADEAESDHARALVLCAESKASRWQGRYAEAARLARHGHDLVPDEPVAVLLAVSEATALQAAGDIAGAQEALARARRARDRAGNDSQVAEAWTCPRAREAVYRLQVSFGAGDPAGMLSAADDADRAWSEGDPWVYGTWAQVRIGAGIAHLLTDDISAATAELTPVFNLDRPYRVATITGQLEKARQRLAGRRNPAARDLAEQIGAFQADGIEHAAAQEDR